MMPSSTKAQDESITQRLGISANFGSGPGVCRGHDPVSERGKPRHSRLPSAIDQVPLKAFGNGACKRRNQPPGCDVVVDVGPDAHGNADAIGGRDYPLIMGTSILVSASVVAGTWFSDVLHMLLDPRVRLG